MTDASANTEFGLPLIDAQPIRPMERPDDRRFKIGLVAVLVVHAMFLVSFNAQGVRHIGDPSGDKDAIGVDFISEADLKRIGTVGESAAGPQTPQAPPTQQTPPPAPPPEPAAQPAPPEPTPPQKPVEQAAVEPKPTPPPPPDPEPALKVEDNVEVLRPPLEPPKPTPQVKPEPPAPRATKQQPTRVSRLDLSLPPSVMSGPSGAGGTDMQRPAGITRSGENDAFARGVISALQRNMPQLRDTRGQVTVRITLDKDGNLVSTQVVTPSHVAGLDQSVVFSTRQSSFPFPPRNARTADLVFLVTYIYR